MPSLLLIGCGKLGGALLSGWKNAGISASSITVVEPHAPEKIASEHGVTAVASLDAISNHVVPDAIILAVKPQQMEEVLVQFSAVLKTRPNWNGKIFVISVAAGKTFSFFAQHLSPEIPVIRAMPNVAALVQQAITAMIGNDKVTEILRVQAEGILRAIGSVVWLESESQLDAVTATSGSGPAYVCYFLESFISAAEKIGLSKSLAETLAKETLFGTVEVLKKTSIAPAELRTQVTSRNGTTEAALEVLLKDNRFSALMDDALRAAQMRSKELGK